MSTGGLPSTDDCNEHWLNGFYTEYSDTNWPKSLPVMVKYQQIYYYFYRLEKNI